MPNKSLIQRKIQEILKQLLFLDELTRENAIAILDDEKTLYLAERVMERLIGAAIDINMHLLKDLKQEIPANYRDSFIGLSKINVLNEAFAKQIAHSIGLRNILIHEYQQLINEKFFEAMKEAKTDYKTYTEAILHFLSQHP
ncbi:DUF86 domain-containing protein [Candidatus Peregrinibacteria bacterium]|nr:MAG: DUF86 domain-containing protein [Candidatus Peregrinibacteria bacterium]